ncbi:MAG: ribosome silencing factor [Acidimicrobiia bacterium]
MNNEALELTVAAARAAEDKLAHDISVRDVGEIFGISESFVIVSARSDRHVQSVVKGIDDALREQFGRKPIRIEGREDASWVLLDYGDIIVHVFLDETRSFYDLDRLWSDAPAVEWAVPASL